MSSSSRSLSFLLFPDHFDFSNYYRLKDGYGDGLTFVLYINGGHRVYSMGEVCRMCASFLWTPFSKLLKSHSHSHSHSLRDWSIVPSFYMPFISLYHSLVHTGSFEYALSQYSFTNLTYTLSQLLHFWQRYSKKLICLEKYNYFIKSNKSLSLCYSSDADAITVLNESQSLNLYLMTVSASYLGRIKNLRKVGSFSKSNSHKNPLSRVIIS